jgi:hypothetical protein
LNLEQFVQYKEKIAVLIRQSQPILNLLFNTNNASPDEDKIAELIHTNNFVPDVESKSRCHICIDTLVTNVDNFTILDGEIYFYILAHRTQIDNIDRQLGFSGNLVDNIISQIDILMNGKHGFGIGKVRLKPNRPLNFINLNNYIGKSIIYTVTDLNSNTAVFK